MKSDDQQQRIQGMLAALRRARTRAEEIAWLNNSEIVILSGGKIKEVKPPTPRPGRRKHP